VSSLLGYLLAFAFLVGVVSIIGGIARVIASGIEVALVGTVRVVRLGERLRRDERLP
jgi:hypothetical protein